MGTYQADNAAYDLSLFNPAKKVEKNQQVLTVSTNRSAVKARRFAVSNILLAMVFAVMCILWIGSYSRLNELTTQASKKKAEYQSLVAQGTSLEVELEKKVDLKQIEDIAVNEYMMQKATSNNVEYISLMGEDKAEVVNQSDAVTSFFANLVTKIPGLSGIFN